MPSRPPILSYSSTASSSQLHQYHHAQIHNLYPLFAQLTFFIIPAKIDEDRERVYDCIKDLGGKCVGLEEARFLLTALKGRARLIRAVGEDMVNEKPILSVEYIYDTFQIALDHAASTSSSHPKLPPREKYQLHFGSSSMSTKRYAEDKDSLDSTSSSQKRRRIDPRPPGGRAPSPPVLAIEYLPDLEPYPPDTKFPGIPKLCVLRPCPLICVNQDIIEAIKPIYLYREFEAGDQKNTNVLSYRRSMSILKSAPRRVLSGKDARQLTDVGDKVAQRIDEFLTTGSIAESEEIKSSPRYQALNAFSSVFTIGHSTSLELYDRHNCRTLNDVRLHYLGVAEESEEVRMKEKLRRRMEGGMTRVDIVEEWLILGSELAVRIPRPEVEEIAACVMEHLSALIPGCQYTLTGGYRRGKTESNDVDIVFCPPKEGQDAGLLRDLYIRLGKVGIVTHVLQVTFRNPQSPIHASANNFDNLDKAFVILKLPGEGRLHRRVDLISAPKDRYAAAVLSWSGSMMFERDLRRHADSLGLKFRAGIVEGATGEEVPLETERDIFHYLGLRFVPPELRNADG